MYYKILDLSKLIHIYLSDPDNSQDVGIAHVWLLVNVYSA